MDSGLYIAVFHLPAPRRIRVGALGIRRFRAGYYFYVGSARRNLQARIGRHARKHKPSRWHIDYLSTKARMLGALLIPPERTGECELAAELAGLFDRAVPCFGASDCRCAGHLFYAPRNWGR